MVALLPSMNILPVVHTCLGTRQELASLFEGTTPPLLNVLKRLGDSDAAVAADEPTGT
jgi:hypothetical protein